MDHRELEDIAADVLLKGRKDAYVSQTVAQMYENAIAVLDVVEPLIRADEQERFITSVEEHARFAEIQVLTALRAKVKALRPVSVVGTDEALIDARADGWDEAIDAVLAMIDGSQ
jgi:hypothetical protein